MDKQTCRQRDRQTYKNIDRMRYTYRHIDRQTEKQRDKLTKNVKAN